ncbi:MAG: hypothetical protein RRB13_07910 [bacterium]|nr:hypothetical protein [bacterium]
MKLAQSVKVGAWLLIALNLLIAFGSIWVFMRMAPAIDVIINQNEVSLEASEGMLSSLLMTESDEDRAEFSIESFRDALNKASNNITEQEEPRVIKKIAQHYQAAFQGNDRALKQTVEAIVELGAINRAAMHRADAKAKQLGYAGAWGVVFMATATFMAGMIFLRSVKKNLLEPILEIDRVVIAFRDGDLMRRCSMKNPPKDIRQIFGNLNDLLDLQSANTIEVKPKDPKS